MNSIQVGNMQWFPLLMKWVIPHSPDVKKKRVLFIIDSGIKYEPMPIFHFESSVGFAHPWCWRLVFACIIYVIEQHKGIKSMRAFHHFCIFLTHTHTAGLLAHTVSHFPHVCHTTLLLMQKLCTIHICTRASTQATVSFFLFLLVFSRLKFTRHTPNIMLT